MWSLVRVPAYLGVVISTDQWQNNNKWEKTEETGENLLQCHFTHYESHMKSPGTELRPPR
jgi:hypothetical protein